jgi:hypothetical protein
MYHRAFLACLLLAASLCRGQSEIMREASPEKIRPILKSQGIEFTEDANAFRFKLEGYSVTLFAKASDLSLRANLPIGLDSAGANAWNRTHRFIRAYLDENGSAVIEADLDLAGGVTRDAVELFIKRFRATLQENGKPAPSREVSAQLPVHTKSAGATKKVKSAFGDFALWIDPAKWKQTSEEGANPVAFQGIDTEMIAQVISEKLGVPTDTLEAVALVNARKADPNAKITFREKRSVNGHPVLALQMDATIKDLPFKYYGYYYGGTSGTIQVVTFTLASAFEAHAAEFTALLDGLEISDRELPPLPKTAADPGVFLVSGSPMAIKYDPAKWKQQPSESGRTLFKHVSGDGYALVISEHVGIPTDSFPEIALVNAQKVDPNAKIVFREKRKVNGADVWFLKLEAVSTGIPITYHGYYYGGPSSAVQILTYTATSLIGDYQADFMDFLNGFHPTNQP